jgi:lipoate-protein ligase A
MSPAETAAVLTVFEDAAACGATNMAADELLAEEAAARGGMLLRLYTWSRPTLSLGGFQKLSEAEPLARAAGLDLVRRPSGGGAILHGTDQTYAAAVSRAHPLAGSPQQLYDAVHKAMVSVLREAGLDAAMVAAGHAGGSGQSAPDGPLLCFDRRAVGDVVVGPHKVLGSAQRRLAGSILQHGSLLLGQCDQAGPASTRPGLAQMAAGSTTAQILTTGATISGESAAGIVHRWLAQLAANMGMSCVFAGPFLSELPAERVAERTERFRSAAWLGRR